MTLTLILEQAFNGLQAGVTLFLVAAGLTLILGIMDVVFLAHGAQVKPSQDGNSIQKKDESEWVKLEHEVHI